MKPVTLFPTLLMATAPIIAAPREVLLPGKSPIVSLRFVFLSGSANDPAGKPGVAALTAAMIAEGGTKKLSYNQIVDALFPMASSVAWQVDKEMTTFAADTHIDNLDAFYNLFRSMLLEPGWRAEDFQRLREDAINTLRVNIRGNNDEELGKEVLYNLLYADHPYGHHNLGTVAAVEKSISVGDLRKWRRTQYTQANLIIGLAGGYPASFLDRVRKDFMKLPAGNAAPAKRLPPKPVQGIQVDLVDKKTRSVAISIGFPIEATRGHPDFIPLLVMQSYFGQHRMGAGRLYQRMRELRGLNYGDYAYIEYFPGGMFRFEPAPNLARPQQIFQIWIRPLEPPTAHFGLRLAMYELNKLVSEGIPEESFQQTKNFLANYVNLLTKTKSAELGYAIDSRHYGIPDYVTFVKEGLAKLTRADVNRVIRKHLRADNLRIVVITDKAEDFKKALLAGEPSPMKYNAPKPDDILQEDKIVEKWKLDLKPENVRVVPGDTIFEN